MNRSLNSFSCVFLVDHHHCEPAVLEWGWESIEKITTYTQTQHRIASHSEYLIAPNLIFQVLEIS